MNRILLIGATGNIGREVLAQMPPANVRALVRNPAAANLPSDIELFSGDLTDPDSVEPALAGVDTVFLVWTAPPPTVAAVVERMAKHARRVVFVSAPLKTPHPFFQQPNSSRALAEEVERRIEASGLAWTFLRPGIFALNSRHFWGPQIRAGDVVRWPYLDAPTAPIDERDIAAVAVHALTEEGHNGMEYVITGPESLTQAEQIATIGRVLVRDLRLEEFPPAEARRGGLAGMPPQVVSKLLDAWSAALGQPAFVSSTFQALMGRPPRTFREWAETNAATFRP